MHIFKKIIRIFPLVVLLLSFSLPSNVNAAVTADGNLFYGYTTSAGVLVTRDITADDTFAAAFTESAAGSASAVTFVRAEYSPTRNEALVGELKVDGRLDIHTCVADCNAQADIVDQFGKTAVSATSTCDTTAGGCTRPFDLAYEQLSGDAMVVFTDTASDGTIKYCKYDGTNWTPSACTTPSSYTFNSGSAVDTKWLRLVPYQVGMKGKRSNEMMMVALDANNDIFAARWDGSAWGNLTTITTTATSANTQVFDVAWEATTGDAMVVWGEGTTASTTPTKYKKWTRSNTTWDSSGTNLPAMAGTDLVHWVDMAGSPVEGKNHIAIMISAATTAGNTCGTGANCDGVPYIWDGSSMTKGTEWASMESMLQHTAGVVVESLNTGTQAYFVTSLQAKADEMGYETWIEGTGFSGGNTDNLAGTTTDMGDDADGVVLGEYPNTNGVQIIGRDIDDTVWQHRWDGSATKAAGWQSLITTTIAPGTVTANANGPEGQAWDVVMRPYSPWSRNWRFYDGTDTAATPTTALANENTTPTGFNETSGKARLRFSVQELSANGQTDARKKLQYTTGNPDTLSTTWTDVDNAAGSGIWRYVDCNGGTATCDDNNALAAAVLSGTPTAGWSTLSKDAAAGTNMDHAASTLKELEYSIEANGAALNTTYYFRMYDVEQLTPVFREQDNDGSNDCATATCTYPSLTTRAFTVAGTANGNNGATVNVAYNGTLQGQTTTISGSAWTITGLTAPAVNDIVTVWVDNVTDANESTAVTKYSSGSIAGMVLNTGVLTVGSNQNTSVSVTNMGLCDQDTGCSDEDIMHTSNSGVLLVDAGGAYTGETLSILSGDTLTVDSASSESITTEKIDNAGTITATGSPTITLNGTSGTLFTNTGTFTQATSTVNLSGNGDATINSGSPTFYNLTSSGTGTKSLGAGITIASGGTLTVSAGTFDPATFLVTGSGTNTLAVSSGATLDVDASTFAGNYSAGFTTITLNSASTTTYSLGGTQTVSGTPTYGNLTISGSGTKTLDAITTVSGTLTVSAGNFDTGNFALNAANFSVTGSATVNLGSSTISLSGTGTVWGYTSSGAVTAGTSTITLTDTSSTGKTFAGGGKTYNNIRFIPGTGTGTYTITGANTFNDFRDNDGTSAHTIVFPASTTTTVSSFTVSGASGKVVTLQSSSPSTAWNISDSSGTNTVSYLSISDSNATGGASWDASDGTNTNGTGNSGWVFVQTISIAGTSNGAGTVAVAVNSTLQGQTAVIGGGSWSITGVTKPATNDIITVWIDGVVDSSESTAITKYGGTGNISGMVLNTGVLTVGSNQNSSLTTTNLGQYDFDNDEDVMHTSNSGALLVQGGTNSYTSETLSVLTSNTLTVASASSESITTEKIDNAGTLTATGSPTITIAGTSGTLFANSGTFTQATSTVTLSGNGDATINSGSPTFYNLTSSGTGTKSLGAGITVASGGTLTVSAGTFDPATFLVTGSGTNTLAVSSGATLDVDASTFAGNYSAGFTTITLNSASTTTYSLGGIQTVSGTPTYGNLTISGSGTKTLGGNTTAAGTVTVSAGTLDTDSGNNRSLTASKLVVSGGTFNANASTINLTGSQGTLVAYSSGTFNAGTSTFNITNQDDQLSWVAGNVSLDWYHQPAVSANGAKMVIGNSVNSGFYYSTNYGLNWTQSNKTTGNGSDAAISHDGTKAVIGSSGTVYYSTDSGATWTSGGTATGVSGVAGDSTATNLAAAAWSTSSKIRTSTDSGANFSDSASITSSSWNHIASSANGQLLASISNGQLYTSTDGGANWTARDSNRNWKGVASSYDGTKLAAVVYGGDIYTSTDSGANWSAKGAGTRNWFGIASSADGQRLVASTYGGGGGANGLIYTSDDAGTTWVAQTDTDVYNGGTGRRFNGPSSSAGGLFAYSTSTGGGPVYVSEPVTLASGSPTFYNLTLASGAYHNRLGEALSVTNNLTISGGSLDTNAASSYAVSAKTLTLNGGAFTPNASTVTITGTSGTLITKTSAGTFVPGTSTVTLSGNGSATVNSGAITFYNLTSSGTGTKTLGGDISVENVLNISSGTFGLGSNTLTLSGSGTPLVATGTFSADTGTVKYTYDGALTIPNTNITYYSLSLMPTITSGRTYSLPSLTIGGNLVINPTASSTLALTVNMTGNVTVSGATSITGTTGGTSTLDTRPNTTDYNLTTGTLSIGSAGTLDASSSSSVINISGTGSVFTNSGTFTVGSSTVKFTADGSVTVPAISYYNLELSPTITTARSYTLNTTNVSNNFTINPTASSALALTVNMGANIVVSGTTTINGTNAAYSSLDLMPVSTSYNLTTGYLNIANSSSSVDAIGSTSIIDITGTTGTLITNTGALILNGPTTLTLSGNGDATINSQYLSPNDLVITGTGTKTLGSTLALDGGLTISAGTLQLSNKNISVTGTTSITGTLNDNSATGTNTFNGNVTINSGGIWATSNNPDFTFGGDLTNNSSSGFTSGSGTYTFVDLYIGEKTLGGTQPFTITNVSNTRDTYTLILDTQYPTIGTLTQGTNAILRFTGSTIPTITTFTATASGNTVQYNNSGQTIIPTTYYNLDARFVSGNRYLSGNVTVNNNFFVDEGIIISPTSSYKITGSGTNTLNLYGEIKVDAATFVGNYESFETINNFGRINYAASGNQTVDNTIGDYSFLMTSGSGTKTLAGSINITNTLYVDSDTVLSPSTYTITGVGTNTLDLIGTINVGSSTFSGSYDSFETINLNAGSTVDYATNGSQTVDNSLSYKNLKLSTGGTKTLGGNTTFDGTLTVASGVTLDPTASYTLTGNGTDTINLTGTLQVKAGTFAGNYLSLETKTFNSGSVIDYAASGAQTIDNSLSYDGLKVSGSGSKTLGGATTTTGAVTISAGTLDTDNSNNYTLNAQSVVLNGGTLAPRASTINLTGTGTVFDYQSGTISTPASSTIKLTNSSASAKTFNGGGQTYGTVSFAGTGSGDFTLGGSNTFGKLKIENPPHTVKFTNGTTQTVTNLEVSGIYGSLNTLKSTSDGSTWTITTPDTVINRVIQQEFLSIRDSIVSSILTFYAEESSNVSNNTGWTFSFRSRGGGAGNVENSASPNAQQGGGGQGGGGTGTEDTGTCTDGIQNGSETGVDTGGRCTVNNGGGQGGDGGDVGYNFTGRIVAKAVLAVPVLKFIFGLI